MAKTMAYSTPDLIVVGNGTSGRAFLERAGEQRLMKSYSIRALDEGAVWRLGGKARGVVVERERALALDRSSQRLETASGRTLGYDMLVLATGMRRVLPENLCMDWQGCFTYRGATDLRAIQREAMHRQRGVVVGGGRHGLTAAQSLREAGLETHIVESASRLLPSWVDETGAVVLHSRIAKLGVEVHLGRMVQEIHAANGRVDSVRLADGSELAADIVVVCPGVRARDELGRSSGLKLGERDGIAIDERCQTSDPHVFALGSVASYNGRCLNWPAAEEMTVRTAVRALAGESASLRALEPHGRFSVLGVNVATFGDAFGAASDTQEISLLDAVSDTYARLVVGQNGTRLIGAMLVGDVTSYSKLLDYYVRGLPLPAQPRLLVRMLSQGHAAMPASLGKRAVAMDQTRTHRPSAC
jgi:nitrite reductase (NADH) large subunit